MIATSRIGVPEACINRPPGEGTLGSVPLAEESVAIRSFRESVSGRAIDLGEAALFIAAEEYPGLDVKAELAKIDILAEEARPTVIRGQSERERLQLLCHFLFETKGYRGNRAAYYDPRNSFLNDVLRRRTGIPISLAILHLEVARRLGIRLVGIGFPMHFLLAHLDRPTTYVDAFSGRLMDRPEVAKLLARLSNDQIKLTDDMLAPVGPRAILERMLRNLKSVYATSGDSARLLRVIDRILILRPSAAEEYRDRGAVFLGIGATPFALADFERFLALVSKGTERDAVSTLVKKLRSEKSELSN
ncbi:MAG: tetratricopeptide repeat protein [Deltaproteobacteria bacterium]|nr:tetratricopeptide repeat protein [Deltaproteobacteria bacterium]